MKQGIYTVISITLLLMVFSSCANRPARYGHRHESVRTYNTHTHRWERGGYAR